MLLKRELVPKSWPLEAVVGTSIWVRRRGYNSAKNPVGFGFKLASKKVTIFAMIDHDRATIGLRSGVDRAPDAPGNVV